MGWVWNSDIYLHYVFELGVHAWRKKHARGDVVVVRYADDTVLGFQSQTEADRFLEDFRERLTRLWRTQLRQRSQRHRLNWERLHRLAVRWLPVPRVLHPWPSVRFAAQHPSY